jgi:hypothetical protein
MIPILDSTATLLALLDIVDDLLREHEATRGANPE